ncbi:universal stress protein [Egbenema bharatensis]|uniref:universal stress protein n=1 Tax=Egbenema bharatensis TaxID=3463334 RepID=UPI003A8B06E1
MIQKILVALDDSDLSQFVFENALSLAKSTHSQLLLIHVLAPTDAEYPATPIYTGVDTYYMPIYEELMKRWRDDLSEYERQQLMKLRSFASAAEAAGVATELTQSLGEPGKMICSTALTWGADLILLGRRGRSGVSEFFLGSVSNYVMHHAPCSVLIVQTPGGVKSEKS